MSDPVARTLRLLRLLQQRPAWPGPELSTRLGVTPRTLRRDVDRLRSLGYPVSSTPGVEGGYRLARGASLPPLSLDDDEAVALAVALRAPSRLSTDGQAEASLSVLAKLLAVMPARLRRQVDAVVSMTVPSTWAPVDRPAETVDPGDLVALAEACRDGVEVSFAYRTGGEALADRRVEPHRLVALGGRWYLLAWDLDRGDWRTFRLDRITGPACSQRRFRTRPLPGPDAGTVVRESIARWAASRSVAPPAP